MKFEDRLLNELRTVVINRAAAGEPSRRFGRMPRLALTGATAAAIVGVGVGVATFVGVGTAPAAWSVEQQGDGMVRVQVYDWSDPEGLERELEKYVSDALVQIMPKGKQCAPGWEDQLGDPPSYRMSFTLAKEAQDSRALDVSFDPKEIPDGRTLVAVNQEDIRMHDDGEWITTDQSGLQLGKGIVDHCDLVDR